MITICYFEPNMILFFLFRWISSGVPKTVLFRFIGIVPWVPTHFCRNFPGFCTGFRFFHYYVVPYMILCKIWNYGAKPDDKLYSKYDRISPGFFLGFPRFFPGFPGFLRFYMVFDGFSSHGCFLAKLTKYFDSVDQPDFPGFCTGFRFFHFNVVPYMILCKIWNYGAEPDDELYSQHDRISPGFHRDFPRFFPVFSDFIVFLMVFLIMDVS